MELIPLFLIFLINIQAVFYSKKIYDETANAGYKLFIISFLIFSICYPLQYLVNFYLFFQIKSFVINLLQFLIYLAIFCICFGAAYKDKDEADETYIKSNRTKFIKNFIIFNFGIIILIGIADIKLNFVITKFYFVIIGLIVNIYTIVSLIMSREIQKKKFKLILLFIIIGNIFINIGSVNLKFNINRLLFTSGNFLLWAAVITGNIVLMNLLFDIINRKYSKIILHKDKSLDIIEEISKLDFIKKTLKENLSGIFNKIIDWFDFHSGAVYICSENELELKLLCSVRVFPPNYPVSKNSLLGRQRDIEEYISNEKIKFGEGIIGKIAEKKEQIIVKNFEEQNEFKQTLPDVITIKNFICNPIIIDEKLCGVCAAINKANKIYTPADIELFNMYVNYIGVIINNFKRQEQDIKQKIIEEELHIARNIQKKLIPEKIPEFHGIDISANYKPAKEVGGDYYDILKIDDEKFAVIIADVSGKGIPAALIMAIFRSVFRAELTAYKSLKETFTNVATFIHSDIPTGMFITALFAVIDRKKNVIEIVNGGHNNLIFKGCEDKEAKIIKIPGMVIGLKAGEQFSKFLKVHQIKINKGDFFFFYTDGVNEAMNDKKEEFGYNRLMKIINYDSHLAAAEFAKILDEQITRHTKNAAQQSDDISFIVMKF